MDLVLDCSESSPSQELKSLVVRTLETNGHLPCEKQFSGTQHGRSEERPSATVFNSTIEGFRHPARTFLNNFKRKQKYVGWCEMNLSVILSLFVDDSSDFKVVLGESVQASSNFNL